MASVSPGPDGESAHRRFLSSKQTVDDRALNRMVVDRLRAELSALGETELRVVELGAGLGTMVARLVEWGLVSRGEWTLVDVDRTLLGEARHWLGQWAARRALATAEDGGLRIRGRAPAEVDLLVRFVPTEIGELLGDDGDRGPRRADLLVANAVLDLLDLPAILPRLLRLVVPDGLYWFSINFDGETIFQPEHRHDARLMRAYHRSMDQRVRYGRPAGESRTGRHLFGHLRAAGASILAAGASDWVVHGGPGGYQADEAYFLQHIVATIDEALGGYPELDPAALAEWVADRRRQIDRGELVYIAHQLDFTGRSASSA